jgi:hypothetical protein
MISIKTFFIKNILGYGSIHAFFLGMIKINNYEASFI